MVKILLTSLSLGIGLGALLHKATIAQRQSVPLAIEYRNTPPCAMVETSTDLTNWFCCYTLSRCDGLTNPIASISWSETARGTNQFFRVLPCYEPLRPVKIASGFD